MLAASLFVAFFPAGQSVSHGESRAVRATGAALQADVGAAIGILTGGVGFRDEEETRLPDCLTNRFQRNASRAGAATLVNGMVLVPFVSETRRTGNSSLLHAGMLDGRALSE